MARSKLHLKDLELMESNNYDFFRNANFIKQNYSYQEFSAFLRLEPYTVELEIILFRLMLKFIDTEDYMYCAKIRDWINKHTK
jgi:hypothetical protein